MICLSPVLEAAVEVERIVRAARCSFCFIGSIAVSDRVDPIRKHGL